MDFLNIFPWKLPISNFTEISPVRDAMIYEDGLTYGRTEGNKETGAISYYVNSRKD